MTVKLSKNQSIVIRAWQDMDPDFDGLNFSNIEKRVVIPAGLVRRTVRALARKGLLQFHRCLWDDDGNLRGAGYGLTDEGREFLKS